LFEEILQEEKEEGRKGRSLRRWKRKRGEESLFLIIVKRRAQRGIKGGEREGWGYFLQKKKKKKRLTSRRKDRGLEGGGKAISIGKKKETSTLAMEMEKANTRLTTIEGREVYLPTSEGEKEEEESSFSFVRDEPRGEGEGGRTSLSNRDRGSFDEEKRVIGSDSR